MTRARPCGQAIPRSFSTSTTTTALTAFVPYMYVRGIATGNLHTTVDCVQNKCVPHLLSCDQRWRPWVPLANPPPRRTKLSTCTPPPPTTYRRCPSEVVIDFHFQKPAFPMRGEGEWGVGRLFCSPDDLSRVLSPSKSIAAPRGRLRMAGP